MGGLRARLASDTLLRNGELDLSGVRFVRPGGLVGLSSLIETWTTEDRPLGVRLPPARVAGYMKRMDVFDILGDRLVYDQDVTRLEIGARHGDASLSELRTVRTEDHVQVVTSEFYRLLANENLTKGEVHRCCTVLSEFLENAVVHAQSCAGAYTAVQTYRMGGEEGLRRRRGRRGGHTRHAEEPPRSRGPRYPVRRRAHRIGCRGRHFQPERRTRRRLRQRPQIGR
jgi:hypothetical protein